MSQLVSIIIPTFNRGSILGETLKSVQMQSYALWECIIVDDGSTDNTKAIVEEYLIKDARFQFHARNANVIKGANSCRNSGLNYARGIFVKWLDSDDLLHPDCILEQVQASAISNCDVCFCQADFFIAESQRISQIPDKVWGKLIPDKSKTVISQYLLNGVRWQTACGLWRKSFLPAKPFMEGLQNSQEWLMHLTMLLLNPRLTFVDKNLCHIRVHHESMSNASNKNGRYYYHQCISRMEALKLLAKEKKLEMPLYRRLLRFVLWNHLFVFYKGAALKGIAFVSFYPKLFRYYFSAVR